MRTLRWFWLAAASPWARPTLLQGIKVFMNESRAPCCWLSPGGGGGRSGWGGWGEGDISFRLHHWSDCCLLPTRRNIIKCQSCCKILHESQGDTVILQWQSSDATATPDSQSEESRRIHWCFPVKKKNSFSDSNSFSTVLRSFPIFWLLALRKLQIDQVHSSFAPPHLSWEARPWHKVRVKGQGNLSPVQKGSHKTFMSWMAGR